MNKVVFTLLILLLFTGCGQSNPKSTISGNLLSNFGFENGLTSWITDTAQIRTSNPLAHEGTNYIASLVEKHTIYQDINLDSNGVSTTSIDDETVEAKFGGWQAGWGDQRDQGQISLRFLDEDLSEISKSEIPFFFSSSAWVKQEKTTTIPVGTRTLRFYFEGIREEGQNNNAYLDAAFLNIIQQSQ